MELLVRNMQTKLLWVTTLYTLECCDKNNKINKQRNKNLATLSAGEDAGQPEFLHSWWERKYYSYSKKRCDGFLQS